MAFSSQRVLILLLCTGFLKVQPGQGYGLRTIDLLRQKQHGQGMVPQNRRIFKATTMMEMNAKNSSTQINRTYDPNPSSKRRVQRGSDPIHNRS